MLQVIERVPRTLAQDLEKVQAGARDYQEISFSRAALKRLYQLTLTLTLLLALDVGARPRRRAVRALRRSRSDCSPKARAPLRRAISRGASR